MEIMHLRLSCSLNLRLKQRETLRIQAVIILNLVAIAIGILDQHLPTIKGDDIVARFQSELHLAAGSFRQPISSRRIHLPSSRSW